MCAPTSEQTAYPSQQSKNRFVAHSFRCSSSSPQNQKRVLRGPLLALHLCATDTPSVHKMFMHGGEGENSMAIYHCSVKIIGRSSGRSSVAAAAYRAGEKITNQRDGQTHDYTRKGGVVHSEIMLPPHAPEEYHDRSTLWNTVEKVERRCDAQTAREVEVALPIELSLEENIQVVREYIDDNFISQGMCADFSIHDTQDGNPHAHIMLTMRDVSLSGFENKNRNWNDKGRLEGWRENWADVCNHALEEKGELSRIDHRSLEDQGLERQPTIHVGRSKERAVRNEEIIKANEQYKPQAVAEYMNELNEGYTILKNHISDVQSVDHQHERELVKIQSEIKALQQRTEDIHRLDDNLQQAHAVRESMGRFQSKKEINSRIGQLEDAYSHSCEYYQRTFRISPSEAQQRIEQLSQEYKKAYALPRTDISQHSQQMREFEMEYKRQRLLAEIRPDGREILQSLDRADVRLNRITGDEFRKVANTMRPRQAEVLRERRIMHDRVRDFEHVR